MSFIIAMTAFFLNSNSALANEDQFLADRIKIMPSGEMCIFEKNLKNPDTKFDRPLCSTDFASDEDRHNHGKEFNERMATIFDDEAKKSLLDGFLESRRNQKGIRSFNTQDIKNFVKHIETNAGCLNARKTYDHQKLEIEKKMEQLKKQMALLKENSESNLDSLVNSCSPYPKKTIKPKSENPTNSNR